MALSDLFTLKPGVDDSAITRELQAGLEVAAGIFSSFRQPFTITALRDGEHVAGSKHYIGQAADLRTNNLDPSTVPQIVNSLQANLGPEYRVILESDHIHVQYNGVGTIADDWPPAAGGGFDPAAVDPAFDLSAAFGLDDLLPAAGVSEAGISGGLVVGLAVAGVAAWLLLFPDR